MNPQIDVVALRGAGREINLRQETGYQGDNPMVEGLPIARLNSIGYRFSAPLDRENKSADAKFTNVIAMRIDRASSPDILLDRFP
jgi:hypothetical protein